MLSVAPNAPADDIKRAFRREIARYHPDKVQHLGKEFQEMAAGIAADLTEAYRILMDPALRTKYDAELTEETPAAAGPQQAPATPWERSAPPPPAAGSTQAPPPPRQSPTFGQDFVKRATMSKLRTAIDDVFGSIDSVPASGFDLAVVSKSKKSLFKKADEKVCVVARFVARVDSQAIADVWPDASRVRAPGATSCVVLLLGSGIAPAKELAAAVSAQRRNTRNANVTVVPVDVRDWEALFPPETPALVRSLIQRLKAEQR
jgi:DnaJ-like protein